MPLLVLGSRRSPPQSTTISLGCMETLALQLRLHTVQCLRACSSLSKCQHNAFKEMGVNFNLQYRIISDVPNSDDIRIVYSNGSELEFSLSLSELGDNIHFLFPSLPLSLSPPSCSGGPSLEPSCCMQRELSTMIPLILQNIQPTHITQVS